jgi:hypothetical protein
MSKNHVVDEEVNVYEIVKDNDINEGDTIEVISNNQQGYKKYKVVNNLGKKELELIESYDDWLGGRRKTRKRKSTKRKSAKRKSAKRKSIKHKSKKSKRKVHKRRSHKRKM